MTLRRWHPANELPYTSLRSQVMILWNYALSKFIVADLSAAELGKVGVRLWLLWAFSLTTGLSLCAVWLAHLRSWLRRQEAAAAAAAAEAAGEVSLISRAY